RRAFPADPWQPAWHGRPVVRLTPVAQPRRRDSGTTRLAVRCAEEGAGQAASGWLDATGGNPGVTGTHCRPLRIARDKRAHHAAPVPTYGEPLVGGGNRAAAGVDRSFIRQPRLATAPRRHPNHLVPACGRPAGAG